MILNDEQKTVIRELLKDNNVAVSAVAGAGKTTTILGLASILLKRQDLTKKVLVLCYNNRLRASTIDRYTEIFDKYYGLQDKEFLADNENINTDDLYNPLDIHTFHSFCHKDFNEPLASTDLGLIKVHRRFLKDKNGYRMNLMGSIKSYSLIIVDEAQDLTETYVNFLRMILGITRSRLCLIGDPRQAIYQFNGSDSKYLLEPDLHFGKEFKKLGLSESFRLTKPMAKFINGMSLQTNIVSNKDSDISPMIIRSDPDPDSLVKFIKNIGEPGNIMILCYSVKRKPYKKTVLIANKLRNHGIKVSIGPFGSGSPDEVLITTFHQAKGLEKPIVICLDLGSFYYGISKESTDYLNNLWYVAITRASKSLIIYCDIKLPFLDAGLQAIDLPEYVGDYYNNDPEEQITRDNSNRSFEDYVKYSSTADIYQKIKNGRKIPDLMSYGDQMESTGIISNITVDFLKEYAVNKGINPRIFVRDYLTDIRGGLSADVDLDIGSAWYTKDHANKMNIFRAIDCCKNTFDYFLEKTGIDRSSLRKTIGPFNNHELSNGSRDLIIVSDHLSLESRLRYCSSNCPMIFNVFQVSWSI